MYESPGAKLRARSTPDQDTISGASEDTRSAAGGGRENAVKVKHNALMCPYLRSR